MYSTYQYFPCTLFGCPPRSVKRNQDVDMRSFLILIFTIISKNSCRAFRPLTRAALKRAVDGCAANPVSVSVARTAGECAAPTPKTSPNPIALTPKPNSDPVALAPQKPPPKKDWKITLDLIKELRSDGTSYPDALSYREQMQSHPAALRSAFEYRILVGLMLSAQTRDFVGARAISRLKTGLGKHGLSVAGVNAASEAKIKELISGVGFHNNKAKYIKQSAATILKEHGGEVPRTMEGLLALRGVGSKMALLVMDLAFGKVCGVSIDTHLHRMLNQLGWVHSKTPEQTRKQLEAWLPRSEWPGMNRMWVRMGQELQHDKEKLLRRVLECSDPKRGLKLLKTFGMDVKKVAAKADLELPQ